MAALQLVLLCFVLVLLHVSGDPCHKADVPDVFVHWNNVSSECVPEVCRERRLVDIPHAVGALPVSLAVKMHLFDTPAVRAGLSNKCVVLLGDSTMQETAHDLVILLSGIASHSDTLHSYVQQATRQGGQTQVCVPFEPVPELLFRPQDTELDCDQGVSVNFFGDHRNMTIAASSLKFYMRMRFTGHPELPKNMAGIQTFFAERFQEELRGLLDSACDGSPPDIVVINSGQHDVESSQEAYEEAMVQLATRLQQLQDRGTRIVWKGNYGGIMDSHAWLDALAQQKLADHNIPFVDSQSVLDHLRVYHDMSCYTTDGIHFGAISLFRNVANRMLISSMVTQELLNAMLT